MAGSLALAIVLAAVVLPAGVAGAQPPSAERSQPPGEERFSVEATYHGLARGTPAAGARGRSEMVSERLAAISVEDVFRQILLESVHHPDRGPALVADWQQQVIDLATGYRVDARSYHRLRALRLQAQATTSRPGDFSFPDLLPPREARQLRGLGCVTKVQEQVVDEVASLEVETLVHVLALYRGVYRRQTVPPPVFWLRDHNRDFLVELAERHHEATGDLPMFVAQLVALADVQRSLVVYSDGPDAVELLERVLELDPDHRVARYWAGYLSEKLGDYRRAARHYGRYLETDGADLEVRLRLAVNQLRTGDRRDGERTLEELAHDPAAAEWMREVAWSELIRVAGDGDARRAVALAREATAAHPDAPGLRLQLAYHRRLTAWDESLAELERAVELGLRSGEAGGRVIYERPREEGMARNRAWLAERTEERRGPLLEVLEQLQRRWRFERPADRKIVGHCDELTELEGRR